MELLTSLVIGAVAAGATTALHQPLRRRLLPMLAVEMLGGMFGLTADFWLTTGGLKQWAISSHVAAGAGATLALTLWLVAQYLFVSSPGEEVAQD